MSKKAVLITSPIGHSATRLMVNLLEDTSRFYLPKTNPVREFDALHQYFIEKENRANIHEEMGHSYNYDELSFILDSYCHNCPKDKQVLIKMPYYPLNCLDLFSKYFDGNFKIIYLERDLTNVIRSFEKRGELNKYLVEPSKAYNYIKKLPLEYRKPHLEQVDIQKFFEQLFSFGNNVINDSNIEVHRITAEKLVQVEYLNQLLLNLGIKLSENEVSEILKSNMDTPRLFHNEESANKLSLIQKILKRI